MAPYVTPHMVSHECGLQGSDIVKGGYDVTSASKCCIKCSEHKKCEYWTYGTSGSRKGKCWVTMNANVLPVPLHV